MVNDRVNIAKRLRKTPEELAKENFYDDTSYKIEPLLFEMVYEIVCGSDEGSYDDVFIKAADLIDPKCYLERSEWIQDDGEHIEWEWHCTNCDFDLTKRYGDLYTAAREELGLLYCPHCGARIIGTIFDRG